MGWSGGGAAGRGRRRPVGGVRDRPRVSITKVVNGFSARLDPTSLSLFDDDGEVTGIFPVRIAYRRRRPRGAMLCAAVADIEVAGLDGSGVTVALLDAGIDPSPPYLRGRALSGQGGTGRRRYRAAQP